MRRLIVITCAVAALAGAGVAGAIVEGRWVTVGKGQWARLPGTDVYCEGVTLQGGRYAGAPAFDCALWAGNLRHGNTFSAEIDMFGVAVGSWNATARTYKAAGVFLNP